MKEFKHIATKEDEGIAVKKVMRNKYKFSSRLMTKIKYQDLLSVNGKKEPGWKPARIGDVITVTMPEEQSHFEPEDIPIFPVYEDEDLLIINKQAGYTVHPTKGHSNHTIANGMMTYLAETNQSFKIRFVNRLDMDTTGLLIIAKNSHTQSSLSHQMETGQIRKYYLAFVNGIIEKDRFTVDLPIGKIDDDKVARGIVPVEQGGSPSVTHVKVLERLKKAPGYTLAELLLETGRTHQIRVHMSHLGYPLVGDYLYGGNNPDLIERQALHAYKLIFHHPVSNEEICVTAPMPEDMKKIKEKVD